MLTFKQFILLINEDYVQQRNKFLKQLKPDEKPEEIDVLFKFHKDNKNNTKFFSQQQKNIDSFKDWKSFKELINDIQNKLKIDKEIEASEKELDQVVLRDDNDWFIVVPLDHNTSCFHGKRSEWCTTKQTQANFKEYFFENEITLVYCFKADNPTQEMWAVALNKKLTTDTEFFDIKDNSLTKQQFEEQTGLKFNNIVSGVKKHLSYINQKREINKPKDFYSLFYDALKTKKRNTYLERLLLRKGNIQSKSNLDYFINMYVDYVMKDRWPEAEKIILKGKYAADYARNVMKSRWPEAEEKMLDGSTTSIFAYARDIMKGRWPEAEEKILDSNDIEIIYKYAKDVIKGRWPEAEEKILAAKPIDRKGILLNPYINMYAHYVIKGRWPEAEEKILASRDVSAIKYYADYVIKGRWPEAEKKGRKI